MAIVEGPGCAPEASTRPNGVKTTDPSEDCYQRINAGRPLPSWQLSLSGLDLRTRGKAPARLMKFEDWASSLTQHVGNMGALHILLRLLSGLCISQPFEMPRDPQLNEMTRKKLEKLQKFEESAGHQMGTKMVDVLRGGSWRHVIFSWIKICWMASWGAGAPGIRCHDLRLNLH